MELARIDLIDKLSDTDLVKMTHVHMILLGHAGVGKTSIRKHFKNEPFDPQEKTTIVADHEVLRKCESPRAKTQQEPLVCETLATKTDVKFSEDEFFSSHSNLDVIQDDKVLLTLWDTGGQPMFQDLLPCFPSLRTLYGIVFRLDNFGDSSNAETRPPCSFEPSVESPFTHCELIHRCLAYVNTFSSNTQGILQTLPSELHGVFHTDSSDSCFPMAIVIGTCKDRVLDSKKADMRNKLSGLEDVIDHCNFSDRLLCPNTTESIAFEVDNTVSGQSENFHIRESENLDPDPGMLDLRRSIIDFTQNMAVEIPASWSVLKIELEKLSLSTGIVRFEDVKAIARGLNTNPEAALIYFHELGIFLWYHYSQKESLKGFVIVNPKKLLEVLSSIFNPAGYGPHRSQWKTLRKSGLLEKKLYKDLLSEKRTGFPDSWVLDFLVEHHLAMPLAENYFIPSMLKVVKDYPNVSADQQASAIFIVFDSNCTAPGLFPRLVTVLAGIDKGNTHWSPSPHELPPHKPINLFCRNQVGFLVNDEFHFVLTEYIDSIRVVCSSSGADLQNSFCVDVLSTVKVQLQRSLPQWLDMLALPFRFTFECKCSKGSARHFLPSLPWRSDNEVQCIKGTPMKLEGQHKIWLSERPSDQISRPEHGELMLVFISNCYTA